MNRLVDYLVDQRTKYQYALSLLIAAIYIFLLHKNPYNYMEDVKGFTLIALIILLLIILVTTVIIVHTGSNKGTFVVKVVMSFWMILVLLGNYLVFLVMGSYFTFTTTELLIDTFMGLLVIGLLGYTTYQEYYKPSWVIQLKDKPGVEISGTEKGVYTVLLGLITLFMYLGVVFYLIFIFLIFFFRPGGV